MWLPPWRGLSALGALGAAPPDDLRLRDEVAIAVRRNIAEGKPFYANVPETFTKKFQQSARGIYYYIHGHPDLMIQGYDTDEKRAQAIKIVNKAYYNAVRGIEDYRGDAPMKSWFYTIARNAMIDDLRMYLRSPEGKARGKAYSLNAENEAGKRKATRAEAEAAGPTFEEQVIDAEIAEERKQKFLTLYPILARYAEERFKDGRPVIEERDLKVLRAIILAKGNLDMAARTLGISVKALYDRFDEVATRSADRISQFRSQA